eukprot:CAMPEP_0170281888 /NCGR_PEP_ID=MMETSP0116_2-20130129/40964_1 /TAXON_ID=400756 /ORGANISM="Durinskia baltica, Strain CSIRO CS-38" /LENGTH=330 /DNA_ID=CAMNT_0010533231 /DNA_START=26 /DNA_END=1018 /DNA_ORIENTATION=-
MSAAPWASGSGRRRPGKSRSRSPAGGWSEWISREVALMGRYVGRRPKGMWADSSGAMRLNDLISAWGEEQGLSKQDVLSALKKHQYHENSDFLRFQLSDEPAGDVTIRVFRRKDAVKSTPSDGAAKLTPKPPSQPPPGVVLMKAKVATPMQERRDKDWREADGREAKRGSSWAKSSSDDGWWTDRRFRRRGRLERSRRFARAAGSACLRGGNWTKSDWGWGEEGRWKDRASWRSKSRSASEAREEPDAAGEDSEEATSGGAAAKEPAATPTSEEAAAPVAEDLSSPPDDPPGDHWTKYTDDGVLWWFYDGPKGKWWKQEADAKPQPWAEE